MYIMGKNCFLPDYEASYHQIGSHWSVFSSRQHYGGDSVMRKAREMKIQLAASKQIRNLVGMRLWILGKP